MSVLAPTIKSTVVQGKTDEFGITSSEFDRAWPIVIGTQRINGNIIWASEIEEVRTEEVQSSGGKAGEPKQETTVITYTYYIDLAVGFCVGQIDKLFRIWADGKIIFDASLAIPSLSKLGVTMDGLNFRFYDGSETQLPDPLIEEAVGVGLTPAYRGLAYIVFERLPLSNFGNRIPQLTVEIVGSVTTAGAVGDPSEIIDNAVGVPNDVVGGGSPFVSFPNGGLRNSRFNDLTNEFVTRASGTGSCNVKIDLDNNVVSAMPGYSASLFNGNSECRGVIESTGEVIGHPIIATGGSQDEAFLFDFTTGDRVVEFDSRRILDGTGWWTEFNRGIIGLEQSPGDTSVIGYSCLNMDERAEIGSITRPGGYAAIQMYPGRDAGVDGVTAFEAFGAWINSTEYQIVRAQIFDFLSPPNGEATYSVVATIVPSDIVPGATSWSSNPAIVPDRSLPVVYVQTTIDGQPYCFAYDYPQDRVLWSTAIPFRRSGNRGTRDENGGILGTNWGPGNLSMATSLNRGFWVWSDQVDRFCAIDLSNGQLDSFLNGQNSIPGLPPLSNEHWHDPTDTMLVIDNDSLWRLDFTFQLQSQEEAPDVAPSVVIRRLATAAGLDESDIDVSSVSLPEPGVKSFEIEGQQTPAEALAPFLSVLQVDVAEIDFQIVFVKRGSNAPNFTIPEDDLVETSRNQEGLPYVRLREREEDLPKRVEVSADDPANQYQTNLQGESRASNATTATDTENLQYPGALTADRSRQSAQTLLWSLWSEFERITGRVSQKWLSLDPTRVGVFSLNNGDELRSRVIKADIGADFTVDLASVIEFADLFVANVSGDTGSGNVPTFPQNTADSNTFIFDIPLVRDQDSFGQGQSIAYWGASGPAGWNGTILYRIDSPSITPQLGKQVTPMPFGVVVMPPPDATDKNFHIEEDQSLVVDITRGADIFAGVTDLDIMNGANLLCIRKANGEVELLQFRDVAVDPNNANRLTLSALLRGVRGTEVFAEGIQVNDEVFLFFSTSYVNLFSQSITTLNVAREFVGVTVGQIFEEAEPFNHTDTGRDLKPYAPVQINVTANGSDLEFTWVRRTRIGGDDDYGDGITDVPLSEDTEEYDLVIYTDATYSSELRVITVTAEAATYAGADIAADGNPDPIHFRVFQKSAQAGRGFASDQVTPRNP